MLPLATAVAPVPAIAAAFRRPSSLAIAGWKMFDAQGALTTDPRYASRVILPYPATMDGALFEASWNECDGPINGNYVGLPCSTHRGLDDDRGPRGRGCLQETPDVRPRSAHLPARLR